MHVNAQACCSEMFRNLRKRNQSGCALKEKNILFLSSLNKVSMKLLLKNSSVEFLILIYNMLDFFDFHYFIFIYLSISLSVSLSIYIYTHTHIYTYIYIYTYTYELILHVFVLIFYLHLFQYRGQHPAPPLASLTETNTEKTIPDNLF